MSRIAASRYFLGGSVLTGVGAVAPPLDRLADTFFAWHMLQHLVMLYLVSLLLVLARPFELYTRIAGKQAVAVLARATRPLCAIPWPPVALCMLAATLWLTHFSPLYEAALEHPILHVGEHLLYLIAGIAFWLPVLAPPPLRPSSYPARLLYLALALPLGAFLGMVIESAPKPLYAHYISALGSVSAALADQRAAAAMMWILGGLVVFSAFLLTLGAWARREAGAEPA